MNKVLLAIPLLALLSIGTVMIISHNKTVELQNANCLTIEDWQNCFHTQTVKICDDQSDPNHSLCYTAANQASYLFYPGSAGELPACQSFDQYFQTSQSTACLNYNNWYQDCHTDSRVLAAAQQSDFYFNDMYKPVYLTCAGF